MTRIRRRLLIDTSIIGIALTLLISILDFTTRAFKSLEDWFYDARAAICQRWTPPPTDKLVHVDIDDAALGAIGRWPWPRANLAILIDEIKLAGAKTIALDIIFPDASPPRGVKRADGKWDEIDDDALLADAIRRAGNVLMPVAMSVDRERSTMFARVRGYLVEDLELSEDECNNRLVADPEKPLGDRPRLPTNAYLTARREAMNVRLGRELQNGDLPLSTLRERLLPRTDPSVRGSAQLSLLADEYNRIQARRALARFMMEPPANLPPLAAYNTEHAQVPAFSQAAMTSGYVNYLDKDDEGIVRSLPLLANYRGKLLPQMNLSLACAMRDLPVRDVKVFSDRVIIPANGPFKEIVIPVRDKFSHAFDKKIGLVMDIPVRGRTEWETLYDHGRYEKRALHLPAAYLWEAYSIRERIARNNANIDRAISTILADDAPHKLALDPTKAKAYAAGLPPPEDTDARRQIVEWTRQQLKESGMLDLVKMTDKDLKNDAQQIRQRDELIIAEKALATLLDQNAKFTRILTQRRADLRNRIAERAVLIGWTATSNTDFVKTPIQPTCPGVVVHGMLFNAIMTGEFWWRAPAWVTFIITLVLGLVVTFVTGFFKPAGALAITLALVGAYLLINGYLFFDYGNWCVGVAGPVVAMGSVWATGTLAGLLIEAAERARITKRFSSYVDPKLVDYVVENPDVVLDGQEREMSVVFTDLQGFTTLSEQLRERIVPILSEYLTQMVPIIRRYDGLVNKFLGDGIMCFFNAPRDDAHHARHAVQACIEMQMELDRFADTLVERGLPRLRMRCGVTSGPMVVGDSGPQNAADYTVLGNMVNTASRLEGANKITGTRILVSDRTVELCGDSHLFRPVGRLQVVGKSEGIMTFEPLAAGDQATGDQRALVIACEKLVAAYITRDFIRCMEIANQMDDQHGPSRLSALYRKISKEYLETPPPEDFAGNLILTEK